MLIETKYRFIAWPCFRLDTTTLRGALVKEMKKSTIESEFTLSLKFAIKL
jgi:hypothetical protein